MSDLIPIGQWTGQRIFKDIFGTTHTEIWFENEETCSCGWGREWMKNGIVNVTYEGVMYDKPTHRCAPEKRSEMFRDNRKDYP